MHPSRHSIVVGKVRVDTTDKQFRKRFSLRFLQHQSDLRDQLNSLGIPLFEISTDSDLPATLHGALGFRSRKGAT